MHALIKWTNSCTIFTLILLEAETLEHDLKKKF